MNAPDLLQRLRQRGVKLELKLRVTADAEPKPDTLELIKENRVDLIKALSGADMPKEGGAIPRLPWQLERLIAAASEGALHNVELQGVPDVNLYTKGWALAYLTSDRDEALRRLWEVYRAWQGEAN